MISLKLLISKPFYYSHSGKWGVAVYPCVNNVIREDMVEYHRYLVKPTKKQLRQLHKLAKSYLVDDVFIKQ